MNYQQLIKVGIDEVEKQGLSGALAQLLMLAYCEEERIDLYSDFQQEVASKVKERYELGIKRLATNEPLAYVLGYDTFYGHDFIIDKRVFVPRPETEELTNEVLAFLDDEYADYEEIRGLDIGTGSGVIAITLVLEESRIKMTACDISEDALAVAKENAEKHQVNIDLVLSDLFSSLGADKQFDFIVCNPPYIKDDEELAVSVRDFEPATALFGGKDGLDYYDKIFSQAKDYLKPKSFLAFEIGYDQAEVLTVKAKETFPDSEVLIKQDINDKDRIMFIINKR